MKIPAEKTERIGSSTTIAGLLDEVLLCGVSVEYSTGLKKTRLTGKDAASRIREAVSPALSGQDLNALRQGILKVLDSMPAEGNPGSVRALCLAPADTDLGLFSILALSAMGAVIVLPGEAKMQAVTETARSHEVNCVVACPLTLSQMMKRLRKKYSRNGRLGSLDKAVSSRGLIGRLFHGSELRQAAAEMTGSSVRVIYTCNDGLNHDVIRFFSRLGYQTGCYECADAVSLNPVETAADIMCVRSTVMTGDGTLAVSLDPGLSARRTAAAVRQIAREVGKISAGTKIVYTTDDLSYGGFRVDRERVEADLEQGKLEIIDPSVITDQRKMSEDEVRAAVTRCFASVLDRPEEEIAYGGDFFRTFNGESLDYFVLLGNLESQFDVELSSGDGSRIASVKDITRCIMRQTEG